MNVYVEAEIAGQKHGLQFNRAEVEQSLFAPSRLHLELGFLPENADSVYDKAMSSWLGESLVLTFGDRADKAVKKKYVGTITSISFGVGALVLHAASEDHLLGAGRKHKSFVEKQVHDIVNEVIKGSVKKHDIKGPSKSLKLRFFHQYDETDADFLKRLARYDGCVFYHDGEQFVYDTKLGGRSKVKLSLEDVSNVVLDCAVATNRWKGAPYDFVKHTDPQATQSGSYSPPSHAFVDRTYQASKKVYSNAVDEIYNEPVTSKPDFDTFLKNQQALAAGDFVTAKGRTLHPMVAIGSTIESEKHAILKNPVAVSALKARYENNVYSAEFQAVAENTAVHEGEADPRSNLGLLQPAIVKDNKDPEKLGRVQIQYLWDSGGTALAWARIVHTGAGATKNGKSYGTHFIPGIGNQVLVGCENGNPSLPIVFGALYHSESKPDFVTENGTEEVLVTRTPAESTIRVIDKQGSEEIVVSMKDNKNIIRLQMSGPKITIESVGGTVLVHSENIQIKADQKIEMEATDIKMTAKGSISLKADGPSELKSTGKFSIEGTGGLEVKTPATCTVEGTGGLTLKNAAAQIAMNGPTVSVNNGALEVM